MVDLYFLNTKSMKQAPFIINVIYYLTISLPSFLQILKEKPFKDTETIKHRKWSYTFIIYRIVLFYLRVTLKYIFDVFASVSTMYLVDL